MHYKEYSKIEKNSFEKKGTSTKAIKRQVCATLASRDFNIGTLLIRSSYILRFLYADLRRIRRKVCLSMAQSVPGVMAFTVAALGMLYRRASSPKAPRLS